MSAILIAAILGAAVLAYAASQSGGNRGASQAGTERLPPELVDRVRQLIALQPANRGEGEALALNLEQLARTMDSMGFPDTAIALRNRAADLRQQVSFPIQPSTIPGGQSTLDAVARTMAEDIPPAPPALAPSPVSSTSPAPSGSPSDLARQVAANLADRGRRYDRALMRRFQRAARLPSTGTYGTATRMALQHYGQSGVPQEYVRTTTVFHPPGEGSIPPPVAESSPFATDSDRRSRAALVAANLRARGRRYDRELMKGFQRAAGLPVTGVYGTATRQALLHYGQSDVPAAYTRTSTTFTPPAATQAA